MERTGGKKKDCVWERHWSYLPIVRAAGLVKIVKGKVFEYGRTLGTTDRNDRAGLELSKALT